MMEKYQKETITEQMKIFRKHVRAQQGGEDTCHTLLFLFPEYNYFGNILNALFKT